MIIDVSRTTSILAYAAPIGVTATIVSDKNKTKEQKVGTLAGLGLATSVSSTLQSCTGQASAEAYIESLSDDQLAYMCELMDSKENELLQAEYMPDISTIDTNKSNDDVKAENIMIKTR